MLGGTWQLVRVTGWQHDGGRWRCLLQWGVSGVVDEGWYLHDAARLVPTKPDIGDGTQSWRAVAGP